MAHLHRRALGHPARRSAGSGVLSTAEQSGAELPSLGPSVDPELRFPSLDARAVLFEDDDIIAIDKPAFVPSQSGRGGDDLPSRVQKWLRARDGSDIALGVHQRLDAMTSGVVVYAKRPEANLALAQAFEQRTAGKRYVAVASGSGSPPVGRLTDRLRHDRGVTRVDGSGDVAACTVSVLEKHRGRALVAIELETGRTHQIRVQLAARGWSVVGDPLYGGRPPRGSCCTPSS